MSSMLGEIVYQKYVKGDSISTMEVQQGLIIYGEAYRAMSGMGPAFRLAINELGMVMRWLEGILEERSR